MFVWLVNFYKSVGYDKKCYENVSYLFCITFLIKVLHCNYSSFVELLQ